jgi:holin-like protein
MEDRKRFRSMARVIARGARYAVGLLILLIFLVAGELVAAWTRLPVPGSVVGMTLLVVALRLGLVRVEWVKPLAELLLRHMALFFVPPGVGLMLYFDLIAAEWLPIIVAGVVSTVIVILVVGHVHQRLEADD